MSRAPLGASTSKALIVDLISRFRAKQFVVTGRDLWPDRYCVIVFDPEYVATCHWPFIQPEPESFGLIRLLAQVEQPDVPQSPHVAQRSGRLR